MSKSGQRKVKGGKNKMNLVYKMHRVQFCALAREGHRFGSKPFGAKLERETCNQLQHLVSTGSDELVIQEEHNYCRVEHKEEFL